MEQDRSHIMEDLLFPSVGWLNLSKQEFLDIADRAGGVQDVVIKDDLKQLIAFSKLLMRIIDCQDKQLQAYDRSEVARF
jgi:hypothetical protein